ncbi:MAG: protein-methionine-sulfoxide reductase catalytic subunit MsrP [Acidobacteriota bacterium]|nr:protein-methionine-sulfoxide reductase catalytic subunit MsrP [Acidobacteriota bacterium]
MLIRSEGSRESVIRSSEITPQHVFESFQRSRRQFLATGAALGAGALAAGRLSGLVQPSVAHAGSVTYTVPDPQTPLQKAATYNNFYEFGTDKDEPARYAKTLKTRPWAIAVEGLVKKPLTLDIDTLLKLRPLENRVYRHRCVEAWSMVIPWDGYSLSELINHCQPLPSAKYVQFLSLYDKKQMPQAPSGYDWPYSEGLRMDEAMNPLALLTFGFYGQTLQNQNGAPVRIILPWKYGFKSAKSIVKIIFTDKQPRTLWNEIASGEYGFYSNVNPKVDHPRWSQAHERRIDGSLFPHTIPTLMFNGYADQVAGMYAGMNLAKYY